MTTIKVVCCYCGADLGEKDGQGVEGISHGICDDCIVLPDPDTSQPYFTVDKKGWVGTWDADYTDAPLYSRQPTLREQFWDRLQEYCNYQSITMFVDNGKIVGMHAKPKTRRHKMTKTIENEILHDPKTGLDYRWNGRCWQSYETRDVSLSLLPKGRAMNDHTNLICLKNGMLDLFTRELRPHHPEYFAAIELNLSWDPEGEYNCDRWLLFLDETVRDPAAIHQVQEFFGYFLTRDVFFAKALLLVGAGSNGKSVMLKILRDMVGPENTSGVSVSEMKHLFMRSLLYHKSVNFSCEMPERDLEGHYFKKIVSGDPINAAFKHKDTFEFVPFCKLVFSANRPPRVLDNSDGVYRRILPIHFDQQFRGGDADPHLYNKLKKELPGIFGWSLIGLQRLINQNGFTNQPKEAKNAMFQV
jgi:putative DNA primase/helicase